MTEIQSANAVHQQQATEYSQASEMMATESLVEEPGLVVVIDEITEIGSTEDWTDDLFITATLVQPEGFSLGVTESAVMAAINKALSDLVNVGVLRRQLNRDFTFLTANNIADQMKTAAEKEASGAKLAFGMAIGGAALAGGIPGYMFAKQGATNKALDLGRKQDRVLSSWNDELNFPMNLAKRSDGSIDPKLWTSPNPKLSKKPNGDHLTPKEAFELKQEELAKRGETPPKMAIKDDNGNYEFDGNGKIQTRPVTPEQLVKDTADFDEDAYKVFGDLGRMDSKQREKSVNDMIAKANSVLDQRSNVTGYDLKKINADDIKGGGAIAQKSELLQKQAQARKAGNELSESDQSKLEGLEKDIKERGLETPDTTPADIEAIRKHDRESAANGFQDQSLTDQLGELSKSDLKNTTLMNIAQLPGNLVQQTGSSAADIWYNKEAKELEAQAARDGATQSFFNDNAGTATSELQGAMSGIEALKAWMESGSAIAQSFRA